MTYHDQMTEAKRPKRGKPRTPRAQTQAAPPALSEEQQIERIAAELVRYAVRVEKGPMRMAYVAKRLSQLENEAAINVLDELCTGAALSRQGFHETLVDLIEPQALREQLGDFMFSRIYHGARRMGKASIVRFLTEARPQRIQDQPSEESMQYGLGELPLGVRKQIARLHDKKLLDRAGYDLDPDVIANLLRNPRTTLPMVLKIASRRPNEAAVLEQIFKSARWVADQTVKEALARNPYTPPRIAMALLNVLLLQQLKGVARDTGLHPEVRQAALELIRRKSRGRGADQPEEEHGA